jgi:outer membrane receptor for ferric coprogen and ferric-rhodotorulic acid
MSCTLSTRGQRRNSSRGLRPLAVAIHMSVAGLLAAGVVAAPLAQAQSAAATHAFNIPSGPLGATLSRIAADAGVLLSFPPALVAGKEAPALRGTLTTDAALDRVLVGSGLVAVKTETGLTLQAAVGEEALLAPVSVRESGIATEGAHTYVARSTNTALGLTLSPRETPQSVSVITRARIEDQALNDISQVLDQTVGVNFNGTSAIGSDGVSFYARGFQVKNFQIDGIPRPPAIYGFSETTTDLAIYDRVEIVRGSTGLMNGAGSPSATINLVRKRPTADARGYVSAQVGSNDHYRLEADAGGPLTAAGNVRGRVVAAYEDSDSHLDRANVEKQVLYGILDIDVTDRTLLTVGVEYQDFTNNAAPRGGVPLFFLDGSKTDFSRSTNVGAKWSDFNHQTTRLFASLEHHFDSGWWIKLDGEESRPDYDEVIGYLYTGTGFNAANGEGANMLSARWAGDLKQRIATLTASGPFTLFGREHELMAGGSYSIAEDQGHNYAGWWYRGDYWAEITNAWDFLSSGNHPKPDLQAEDSEYGGRIEQTGAYTAVRLKPTDKVSVILGGRVSDWKETEWSRFAGVKSSSPVAKKSGVVTPYAGVVVDLDEHFSAYASYTEIFEPQNYVDQNHSRIDPLEGVNYEVGMKAEFADGALNASAAVFRIEQDNFAVAVPGAVAFPDGSMPYRAETAVSKGVEVEVAGEALPGWQVGGGYARAKSENPDGERLLREIPKDTFKFFSTYKLPGAWSELTVGGNLRWQGKVYTEGFGPNDEVRPFTQGSLVLVDLMAKYALTPDVSLAVNLSNVFDKEYYSGLSGANGVYGNPRNMTFSARYSY